VRQKHPRAEQWHFSFVERQICHWWQEQAEGRITAMTGFVLLLLIVAAIAVGLEAHYRRVRDQLPYFPGTADPDLLHEQRDLRAWR
jgi:hypothetical protein